MSDSNTRHKEIKEFINSHKYKMEVGAANRPICNGVNTTFVDHSENLLIETAEVVDIHRSTEFIVADAADIPVKSSSMDCIVSSYFSWGCNNEHRRMIYFFEMLSEWKRIIKKTGHIVIISAKTCTEDILQMCDMIGLNVVNVIQKGRDFTIILQKA